MIKIDLHTHSFGSKDGGLSLEDYARILRNRTLHYVAITDHNEIDTAQSIKKVLGDRIIVGEEIMTTQGEIVGLYLKKRIEPGMSAADTIAAIKSQKGLVLIPHPFETVRSGIKESVLKDIVKDVDMIEVRNGRALWQNRGSHAKAWSVFHEKAMVACSDAHSLRGIGRTYSKIPHKPTKSTLVALLGSAEHNTKLAKLPSLLAPKINRVKRIGRR